MPRRLLLDLPLLIQLMKWGRYWLWATTIFAANAFFHVTDASTPPKGVSGWTAQRKLLARCVLIIIGFPHLSNFCLARRHESYGIMASIATWRMVSEIELVFGVLIQHCSLAFPLDEVWLNTVQRYLPLTLLRKLTPLSCSGQGPDWANPWVGLVHRRLCVPD